MSEYLNEFQIGYNYALETMLSDLKNRCRERLLSAGEIIAYIASKMQFTETFTDYMNHQISEATQRAYHDGYALGFLDGYHEGAKDEINA